MKIIGLAGPAGAGKDTVASLLLDEVSGVSLSFAQPLRRAVAELFLITEEQMTDRALKEKVIPYWGVSPRQILQRLGTEFGRDLICSDVWVRRAALELEGLRSGPESGLYRVAVYTDVRFREEAAWIERQGGVILHVDRPGVAPVSEHRSESGLPIGPGHFVIRNHGDIDELRVEVRRWWRAWSGAVCVGGQQGVA